MKKYLIELVKKDCFIVNEAKLKAFRKQKLNFKKQGMEVRVFELK